MGLFSVLKSLSEFKVKIEGGIIVVVSLGRGWLLGCHGQGASRAISVMICFGMGSTASVAVAVASRASPLVDGVKDYNSKDGEDGKKSLAHGGETITIAAGVIGHVRPGLAGRGAYDAPGASGPAKGRSAIEWSVSDVRCLTRGGADHLVIHETRYVCLEVLAGILGIGLVCVVLDTNRCLDRYALVAKDPRFTLY